MLIINGYNINKVFVVYKRLLASCFLVLRTNIYCVLIGNGSCPVTCMLLLVCVKCITTQTLYILTTICTFNMSMHCQDILLL